jgi:hypothetical protein
MRRIVLTTLLAAVTSSASLQSLEAQRAAVPRIINPHARPAFFPPLFVSPFYSDAFYDAGYPVSPQPPIILVQAPPQAQPETAPAAITPPANPLLIELQDGRYVRVSGEEAAGSEMIDQQPASRSMARPAIATDQPSHELVPVILVFRDGNREEVTDYTIADGVIYARADYFTGGSWNKKIELTALNLPETFALNRSRGVAFRLPSAPNEVITRP